MMKSQAQLQAPAVARAVQELTEMPEPGNLGRGRGRRRTAGWLLSELIVVLLILAWQAAIWIGHLESVVLPTPRPALAVFGQSETRSLILDNISPTLTEAMIGFVLCLLIGSLLAVAMFASRIVRDAL